MSTHPSPTGTQNDMTEALLSGLLSYIQSLSGKQHQASPMMCRVSFQSTAHATLLPPQPVAMQRRCCHSCCELHTLTAPTPLFSLSPKPSAVLTFTDWGNSTWDGNITSGGALSLTGARSNLNPGVHSKINHLHMTHSPHDPQQLHPKLARVVPDFTPDVPYYTLPA